MTSPIDGVVLFSLCMVLRSSLSVSWSVRLSSLCLPFLAPTMGITMLFVLQTHRLKKKRRLLTTNKSEEERCASQLWMLMMTVASHAQDEE